MLADISLVSNQAEEPQIYGILPLVLSSGHGVREQIPVTPVITLLQWNWKQIITISITGLMMYVNIFIQPLSTTELVQACVVIELNCAKVAMA